METTRLIRLDVIAKKLTRFRVAVQRGAFVFFTPMGSPVSYAVDEFASDYRWPSD